MMWLAVWPSIARPHEWPGRDGLEAFRAHEQLILVIAPEGACRRGALEDRLLAHADAAGVPVVLSLSTGGTKVVGLGPAMH